MLRVASFLFFTFIISYCFGQTATLDFKVNTSLTFKQTINGARSDVKVGIQKDPSQPAPKISWSVHNGDKSTTKIYNYTAKSVADGNTIYLRIDGMLTPPNDANIILISKESFHEIKGGQTVFNINGKDKELFTVLGKEKYSLHINGKPAQVEAYHLQSQNNVEELWILNNSNNPIILKASGLFNMELTEADL